MKSSQREEKYDNNANKTPLHYYSLAPELNTQAAATLFFDKKGKINLLNKNLSITQLRLFLMLSTYCEPETNICSFKSIDRLSILISLSKQGFEYKEKTIIQAKKDLTKNGFIVSLKAAKRGYVMLNPAIIYYAGKRTTARFRYGKKKQIKNQSFEITRQNRIKDFLTLQDQQNPIGQKQTAEKLFEIYLNNEESKHMPSYSNK